MSHHRPPPPPWTFIGSFYPRNVLFAGIGAAITMYFSDFIVFGGLFGDFFVFPGMRATPLMLCMITGYVFGGLIFSAGYAFYAWPNKIMDSPAEDGAGHSPKTTRGLLYGVIIACVVFVPSAFIYHSLFEGWSLKVSLVEVGYRLIQFGLIGILVAHMLTDSDSVEGTKREPIKFK